MKKVILLLISVIFAIFVFGACNGSDNVELLPSESSNFEENESDKTEESESSNFEENESDKTEENESTEEGADKGILVSPIENGGEFNLKE